jgi:hypothetical protein
MKKGTMPMRLYWNGGSRAFALLVGFLAGCTNPARDTQGKGDEEVRQAFQGLQKALNARDADKVWSLLDEDSQADARRAAQAVRDAYGRGDKAGREEMQKALGLPAKELAALEGNGFLKTRRFLGKYDELGESKIDKIDVKGDKAVVNFTEPDGDKEKLAFVREKGGWKASLPIPKAIQP